VRNHRVRIALALALGSACLLTSLTLTAARATSAPDQIPRTFTNLQVLPKDIPPGDLIGVMKGYAINLGVRCQYCHIGEEGADLGTFDFVSDTKAPKATARRMQQMVNAINNEFLKDVGAPSDAPKVTCFTCHRGAAKPPAAAGGEDMK
jgi:hypothetical protein